MKERAWIIGSAPDCDIRVDRPAVSGRHCRLVQRGPSFFVEDLNSTNGTFVAGQRIGSPRSVAPGDKILLGQNAVLPWPDLASITIGRLPDNDYVIPLDTVSSHHARLEREGGTVYLVDLGSTNGTAVNDPLKKIGRAEIRPGDVVYLGTYRLPASELLAALPGAVPAGDNGRQATVFEGVFPGSAPGEMTKGAFDAGDAPDDVPEKGGAWKTQAWLAGIAIGAACVALILLAAWAFRGGATGADANHDDSTHNDQDSTPPPKPSNEVAAKPTPPLSGMGFQPMSDRQTHHGQDARATAALPAATSAPPAPPAPPEFNEARILQSANAINLVAERFGHELIFTHSVAWAIAPDRIVCRTSILEDIGSKLDKSGKVDDCLVVCNRGRSLRIMKHMTADGDCAFLSVGRLEAPTDAVAIDWQAASKFVPVPGQKLGVLIAEGKIVSRQPDNPATISTRLVALTVDHIERDEQLLPTVLYCKFADSLKPLALFAGPVFDGHGQFVGCVRAASKNEAQVVPLARLTALSRTIP